MSKQRNNPMMNNASGMIGKAVVFKKHFGDTVIASRPKKSSKKVSDAIIRPSMSC
jgi:hypothetical protein